MAIGDSNVSHTWPVLGRVDHITVSKNLLRIFLSRRERLWGPASHVCSRLFPPAPLTGDVGRDRGDAGRALLFLCALESPKKSPARLSTRRIAIKRYSTPIRMRPPWARGCASCAGRTAPGLPPPTPSRAGTALRSGTPAPAARR